MPKYDKSDLCGKCGAVRQAAPFCSLCGAKNEAFNTEKFAMEYGDSLESAMLLQCAQGHSQLKREFRSEFPVESPLFCDLCGEQVIFDS
jgi:hypothetical protein